MKTRCSRIAVALCLLAQASAAQAAGASADLVLTHGAIYTVDATHPWAEAVAIKAGIPYS
jgi:TRAP-type C4-dicarboxylate transport system substrate-binding protein